MTPPYIPYELNYLTSWEHASGNIYVILDIFRTFPECLRDPKQPIEEVLMYNVKTQKTKRLTVKEFAKFNLLPLHPIKNPNYDSTAPIPK